MRLSEYYGRVEFDGRRGRPAVRAAHVDYERTIYRPAARDGEPRVVEREPREQPKQ